LPKIVDHEQRREEVLAATWRVIARVGLDATTIRRIADEAGHSVGVLTHYFTDKEDILRSAHLLAFARARARIDEATEGRSSLEALRLALLEALPLDEERLLEAHVDVSFLGHTVGNAKLRQIRSRSNAESRELWGRFVTRAQDSGELRRDEDTGLVVDEIQALIESLSIQAIIDPARMTPGHQEALVDRLLSRLGPTGS
jgi:AcrR family transcriptional regulator